MGAKFRELSQKGWTKPDMDMALNVSRGDRELFNLFVQLRDQKVDPFSIGRSFEACKGEPAAINEYWGYVIKNRFSPLEVDQVFRTFPPNNITRWHYFYYRTGGFPQPQQPGAAVTPAAKTYTMNECLNVFRLTRFDVNFVKEYFTLREQGKSAKDAWAAIKDKVKADLDKEKEQERKRQEAEKNREKKQTEESIESRKKIDEMTKSGNKPEEKPKQSNDDEKARRLTPDEIGKLFESPKEDEKGAEEQKGKKTEGEASGGGSGSESEPPSEQGK
jgi:hypothetical protein